MSRRIVLLSALGLAYATAGRAADYDPLRVPEGFAPEQHDLVVRDQDRDREIPALVYLPKETQPAPVVLFSHGLGGARTGCKYLATHWTARGYVAVFLQHPGSDDSVWKDVPLLQRMLAMRRAASGANFKLRAEDVPAVLDQLKDWHADSKHPLAGRLDLSRVGMSGHSFGAVTTQATSGQSYAFVKNRYTDGRIKAAIALSPSVPPRGDPGKAFERVRVPWMLMTGTRDTSPIGQQTVESRQQVFPNLPAGDKYELVLHDAEHSAFTERALPGDQVARNPNHHRAVLALSTAFWDTYLRGDEDAKKWLQGAGPKSVLEEKDGWRTK